MQVKDGEDQQGAPTQRESQDFARLALAFPASRLKRLKEAAFRLREHWVEKPTFFDLSHAGGGYLKSADSFMNHRNLVNE